MNSCIFLCICICPFSVIFQYTIIFFQLVDLIKWKIWRSSFRSLISYYFYTCLCNFKYIKLSRLYIEIDDWKCYSLFKYIHVFSPRGTRVSWFSLSVIWPSTIASHVKISLKKRIYITLSSLPFITNTEKLLMQYCTHQQICVLWPFPGSLLMHLGNFIPSVQCIALSTQRFGLLGFSVNVIT